MKLKICWLCVAVSGAWLLLQAGIVNGLLVSTSWPLVVALGMGATVSGIAYQRPNLRWKWSVVIIGLPLAYTFLANIGIVVIVAEITILLILAYHIFPDKNETLNPDKSNKDIADKLKNCC